MELSQEEMALILQHRAEVTRERAQRQRAIELLGLAADWLRYCHEKGDDSRFSEFLGVQDIQETAYMRAHVASLAAEAYNDSFIQE